MLFMLTTSDAGVLKTVDRLAGDEDKELLLISDAVYLAREAMAEVLSGHSIDEVYAEEAALAKRGIKPSSTCETVDMDRIVEIVLNSQKLIQL
ncbi:MAG: DsrH/TusB family sulfur relay protein [Proteobacteria bacterium]|nr:DsrH/TusB family sulfur relay protein [Pseudomonadota bacterium]MBU1450687.1 DsrH/TusB family sulfur relay protein [Pseudomonadota bacterium]MBU2468626.1 DsrH/TusB family sulfur relay protein [Pseudomonadota bacterium]MBU2518296.1 DsrH/TusB family sulfur relay protein [Pseudomonadota bacterium]